jgi:two-component system nitrate/nitrite response regulator NarL
MAARANMQNTQQSQGSLVHVVVVEANYMNCQLVESALRRRRNGIGVIASAVASSDALGLLKQHEPDVAVISAELQDGPLEGYRVLREVQLLQSRTRTIMLLDSREREPIIDAFRCGARGVVLRDEPLEALAKSIHAVHRGQVWANSQQLSYLLDALGQISPIRLNGIRNMNLLSKREVDVVCLVADGMTNREISAKLRLSEHTIRNYLFRIFDKIGVSTRVELVLYCLQERPKSSAAGAS